MGVGVIHPESLGSLPHLLIMLCLQGCRPLSDSTWAVERIDRASNRILALREEILAEAEAGTNGGLLPSSAAAGGDGRRGGEIAPLGALQRELMGLAGIDGEGELRRVLQKLVLGFAPDNMKASLQPHDFLIRSMGIDTQVGGASWRAKSAFVDLLAGVIEFRVRCRTPGCFLTRFCSETGLCLQQ